MCIGNCSALALHAYWQKCHLNLAHLGSGVCVKNAHHMFGVTLFVFFFFCFFFTSPPPPQNLQSCGISSCLCLRSLNIAKWGEGWGEGTAPTLLGRIWDIRKCYMTSRANWMSVFYADPGIRFCCFGDHVVYTYYCFAETRLVSLPTSNAFWCRAIHCNRQFGNCKEHA